MSARQNAQAAALEALIEAHATELKLPTVKARFRQMAAEAAREQQTPVAYLAALLQAEHQERAERRERRPDEPADGVRLKDRGRVAAGGAELLAHAPELCCAAVPNERALLEVGLAPRRREELRRRGRVPLGDGTAQGVVVSPPAPAQGRGRVCVAVG
jgi:hypothetical protein